MLQDPSPRRRWPRSQRFALTDKGRDAEASYRSSIVSSRSQEGRRQWTTLRCAPRSSSGLTKDQNHADVTR